jgi:hypothetical protein
MASPRNALRLLYSLRSRPPCLFLNRILAAQFTFCQQPQKVNKKGRAPAKFYHLRDLPNRGRKEVFPTHFAKMTSLSFILY